MKVKITIEETVSETFVIDVPDDKDGIGDATDIGKKMYENGSLVLEPGKIQTKQIMAESIDDKFCTDWEEF